MIYDSDHVFHVSKTGNDANGGLAQQYPISLVNDSKLTIGSALSAAASGDTIIIWPGDYAETVNLDTANKTLTIIGTDRYKSKIVPASGNALVLENGCTLLNLNIEALEATTDIYAVNADGKTDILIDGCIMYGRTDGLLMTDSFNYIVKNSRIKGKYDGVNVHAALGFVFDNCVLITDGTYGTTTNSRSIFGGGRGCFNNCSIIARRIDTTANNLGGCIDHAFAAANMTFNNCLFDVDGGANQSGEAYGVKTTHASTMIIFQGCSFSTVSASAGTGPFDLYNTTGTIVVNGCAYSTTSGTITIGDSGFAAAVNTQADTALSDINLDHLMKVACGADDVVNNTALAKIVSKDATADWSDFTNTTESLEALKDGILNTLETKIDNTYDNTDTIIAATTTTNTRLSVVRAAVLTDWINGGRLDLILDAILADTAAGGSAPFIED